MNHAPLYSDIFEAIDTNKDLDDLCDKFPGYDRGYLCQAAGGSRKSTREWMEQLWQQYMPYADPHYCEDFKRQFTQRSWELYLGATFVNRGCSLSPHSQEGPDFDVCDKTGKRLCWVEAISVKKGDGVDRVPEMVYNGTSIVPTDEIALRLAGGLDAKFKKYLLDCKKGTVSDADPYVIAIDRSGLEHLDAMPLSILKVLFGIGNLVLRIPIDGNPGERAENVWTHQPVVQKKSGKSVSMHFFDNPDHAGISAVIYCKDSIINSPRKPQEMGENCVIIHNPLARNRLPQGFLPFGQEYIVEGGLVKRIREAKSFNAPDPFE